MRLVAVFVLFFLAGVSFAVEIYCIFTGNLWGMWISLGIMLEILLLILALSLNARGKEAWIEDVISHREDVNHA
jgi:uncharacterized membrane protein